MFRLSLIFCLVGLQLFAQSPHGDFDMDCSECHSTDTWKIDITKLQFNHSSTEFILSGEHNKTECRSCHTTLKFNESKSACIDCHIDVHELTLGAECANCHSPETWVVSNITEIHQGNRFPLLGAHYTVDCQDCHVSSSQLKFEPLDISCFSCHSEDYYATAAPNHVQSGFSTECEACHNMHTETWSSLEFDHQMFPLTGGHQSGDCFMCHSTDGYAGLSQQCYSCHSDEYNSVKDPDHLSSSFSHNCEECHSTNPGWTPVQFSNHNDFYVLAGAHANITDCNECHSNGYTNTPVLCYDCHTEDYSNANNPPHEAAGFSQDCESCHSQNNWIPATFDHDEQYFPIYFGSHREEWDNCNDCHTNQSDYSIFTCIDCHEHNQSDMNEDHRGVNGYIYESASCFECHPTGDGDDMAINHSLTNFPLLGAHLAVSCNLCHISQDEIPGTLCVDCHRSEYDQVTDPKHQELNFSLECEDCHTSDADWPVSQFTIHNDFYLLTGAHIMIADDCASCHSSGYSVTSDQCYDCHSEVYNSSTNPNHSTLDLSQLCESCHTTDPDWFPATFPEHDQYSQLLGAHSLITDCADCHIGNYNTTFIDCNSCHSGDYNSASNPPHSTNGFSTDCESCHTENAWIPSTFDHDAQYFPINSGKHKEKWDECSDCHTVASNYAIFSCIDCHDHNQSKMDDKHKEEADYIYNSNACLDCHPDGNDFRMRIFENRVR